MCRFKAGIAVRFGINAAVIAQFLWESITDEYYDETVHEKDGQYWCRCSMLMMTGVFPFLSRNMVKNAIDLLIKKRVIVRENFNDSKFDKTSWYTFTDYGAYIMSDSEGDFDG